MRKIFTASVAITVMAFSIALFQVTSCQKTTEQTTPVCPPAVYPIEGLWEGTYQTDQDPHPPTYASFIIYDDGTFMKRDKIAGNTNEYGITRGTWKLTGDNFTYKDTILLYSGGSFSETGTLTFNNKGTLTNGTWQHENGESSTGTFQTMIRIN